MGEKKYNENGREVQSPFVRLDKCNAIVNSMDYDSNGRLSYMPYNGIDNNDLGNPNKIISSPDEYTEALQYSRFCVSALSLPVLAIPDKDLTNAIFDASDNIEFVLMNRVRSEVHDIVLTVLFGGLRSLYYPYIINAVDESNCIRSLDREVYHVYIVNMFDKDEYRFENGRREFDNNFKPREKVKSSEDIAVKSSKIIQFVIADIVEIYNKLINNIALNMDFHKFAEDAINEMGLDRSQVSVENDLPYTLSVLHERANNDIAKISELVEMVVNHAYYIYARFTSEFDKVNPYYQVPENTQKCIERKDEPFIVDFNTGKPISIPEATTVEAANNEDFREPFKDKLIQLLKNK